MRRRSVAAGTWLLLCSAAGLMMAGCPVNVEEPGIDSVAPAQGPVGTEVTVLGRNFDSRAQVLFNGVASSNVNVVSSQVIRATAPSNDAGLVSVSVVNSSGLQTTAGDSYTYTVSPEEAAQRVPPTLIAVNPPDGPTTGGTRVTIQGSGLSANSRVFFAGAPATDVEFLNSSVIRATTPPNRAGAVPLLVVGENDRTANLANAFTYVAEQALLAPALVAVGPSEGSFRGGTRVTIRGRGFTSDMIVLFNNVQQEQVQFISPEVINIITRAAPAGLVDVTVVGNNGLVGLLEDAYAFIDDRIIPPPLAITAISPPQGSIQGGTIVSIQGSGFDDTVTVLFGDDRANSLQRINENLITMRTAARNAGRVNVRVALADGRVVTQANAFEFVNDLPPPPVLALTSVSPAEGDVSGGDVVTLLGSGFAAGLQVFFDNKLARNVTIVNANALTVSTPPNPAGAVAVKVLLPDGRTSELAGAYTYIFARPILPPLSLDTAAPINGPIAGGTEVTLSGTGFTPGTLVLFGDVSASEVHFVSENVLHATTPAAPAGTVDIRIVREDGAADTLSAAFTYEAPIAPPALAIQSLAPAVGPVAGGTEVTILGEAFDSNVVVLFDGIPGTALNVRNANVLSIMTPAGTAGLVDVSLQRAGEPIATLANGFEYQAAPAAPALALTALAPATGPIAGGTQITLLGAEFDADVLVFVGGVLATNLQAISDTVLVATTPAGTAGAADVQVRRGDETATLAGAFTYEAPTPDPALAITALAPANGPVAGGTVITMLGDSFDADVRVLVGGVLASNVTVVSSTILQATTPAGAAGTVDVEVRRGAESATLAGGFTYEAPLPPPPPPPALAITALAPTNGPIAGGTVITMLGDSFDADVRVLVGGVLASNVTLVSSTILQATTPAGAAGAVDVQVRRGTESATLAGAFTYAAAPTPPVLAITAISPAAGPEAGGTRVTILGDSFDGDVLVLIGGAVATNVTALSGTVLQATTPAGTAGAVDVEVRRGTESATLAGGFTYEAAVPPPALAITALSPDTGPVAGGTVITMLGESFDADVRVLVGGVLASNVTVVSSTILQATTPAGAAGAVDVEVRRGAESATSAGAFTYEAPVAPPPPPALAFSGIAPDSGPIAGGTRVTIIGDGFTTGVLVLVGGVVATDVSVLSSSVLQATTPAGPAGPADVEVRDAGTSAGAPGAFTYQAPLPPPAPPALAINAVAPQTGSEVGGTRLTILGDSFDGDVLVLVGGVLATDVSAVSSTVLQATTPAGAVGTVDVEVRRGAESDTLAASFTYVAAPPPAPPPAPAPLAINALAPIDGPIAGGTRLTILGDGFEGDMIVLVDGVVASDVDVLSASVLQATTPAGNAGAVDVQVRRGTDSDTLAASFTYEAPVPPPAPISPTITSVTPGSGPVSGGTSISILGAGFADGTGVLVGGVAANSVVVVNPNLITAVTSASTTAAIVDVTVLVPGQPPATSPAAFEYLARPVLTVSIDGIGPARGIVAGGTAVTILGTGFTADTRVFFGGAIGTSHTLINEFVLQVTTPPSPRAGDGTGLVDVSVLRGVDGATTSVADGFRYVVP